MCQAPDQGPEFWDAAARVLAGRSVEGITGVPDQVDAWVTALGLKIEAFAVKETEPLYRLDLEELRKPNTSDLTLRRPTPLDRGFLCKWFEGYSRDTGMRPTDGATSEAAAETFSQHDAARILALNGEPVAMTSLNARVTDTVQIGGVYVPDVWRGRGFGGAAVALQLAELKAQGVKTAILFAANEIAAKAYERIGFNLIGEYEIALFKAPLKVEGNDDVF
ncbi:acetyltransferase [Sulfitobacter donghicola DSW-25 = KCTC 12864 = JCM 14565]|nr:acetyltransferase [Sulfitobacter donghicola DSW-25 = KCTC 12864 = JCM 14565]